MTDYQLEDRVVTVEEYCALRASVGWRIHPSDVSSEALKASLAGVCVLLDGRPVGMGRAVGDRLYRFVVDVVVDPAHQGKGLGRRILDDLTRRLDEDYPPIVGLVAARSAAPFYERCGLVDDGDPFFTVPRKK